MKEKISRRRWLKMHDSIKKDCTEGMFDSELYYFLLSSQVGKQLNFRQNNKRR